MNRIVTPEYDHTGKLAGYRIKETVTLEGHYIFWPELFASPENAWNFLNDWERQHNKNKEE